MTSFLQSLATLIAGKPKSDLKPAAPAANGALLANGKPKSPERIVLEQSILANRRKILANMAEARKQRAAAGISTEDDRRADDIAIKILLSQKKQ